MKMQHLFLTMKKHVAQLVSVLVILFYLSADAHAVRIKDIADIEGVRKNQLVGYGLVVGLDGTGDGNKSEFTLQSMSSMLDKMGIKVDPDDVDGQVYAIAQGPVITGGFSASGSDAKVQKNFPTVARIINGAVVEREIPSTFSQNETLSLALHSPDFTTVSRVAEAINMALYDRVARTPDSGTVEVKVPENYLGNLVELITLIEGLNITPDSIAKVVINERTGTVVIGRDVRITTIAIAHGNLSVAIKETADVSQPLPFSRRGRTVVTSDTDISVEEEKSKLMLIESGVSIGELVRALNALGVSPRDLITIFQSLRASGALQAELETI